MSAAALLAELRAAGAELTVDPQGVRFRAPRPLPAALLAQARALKPELRRLLEQPADPAADIEAAPAGISTTEPPPDPGPPVALAGAGLPDPADPNPDPELEAPVGFVARPPALPPTAPLPPFRWGSVVPLALEPPRAPHRWPHPLGDGPTAPRPAPPPAPSAPSSPPRPAPLPPRVDREGHLSAIEAASVAQLGPVRGFPPLAPSSPDVSPGAAAAWREAYQRRLATGLDIETAERLTCATHGPRPE